MSSASPTLGYNILKQSSLFSSLPDEQLNWLVQNGEHLSLDAGDILMAEGSPPDALYVIIDGEFDIYKNSGESTIIIAVRGSGEIMGEMSLIEDSPRSATVRAISSGKVLKISREVFNNFLCGNPTVSLSLLRMVMSRLRNTEAMLKQQEKLASLGTLAAGLAHELNNPAAAARRSVNQLQENITNWIQARLNLDLLQVAPWQSEKILTRLMQDVGNLSGKPIQLDPLERSDRESEIESWLELQGLENAWEYAPILVAHGWDALSLESWMSEFNTSQIAEALRWLSTGYSVYSLMAEIDHSSERISEIVSAVKNYSYLDQAPRKEIDIHDGLESTLVILKHKLKQGITVQREYDRSLPHIQAYGSELNQVWTNIIDNAIDAMHGNGTLLLRTYLEKDCIIVEIVDNGPGIPPQVLARIFEPFYTTKAPGEGSGLGLHVSFNIIRKHRGRIDVQSKPGDTCFKVVLPLKQDQPSSK